MKTTVIEQSPSAALPARGHALSALRGTMRSVLSNSFVRTGVPSVVDQAVVSGTAFLTTVIIGRCCTQADFGIYYLAFTIAMLVRGIQVELVSSPYTVYCSRQDSDSMPGYSGSSLIHHLVLTVVAVGVLLLLAGTLSLATAGSQLVLAVWVMLGALPLLLLREFIRQFSFSHLRPAAALAIDVTIAGLQIGGLVLLALFGSLSVAAIYTVMGVACAVACFGWFVTKKEPLRFERARIKKDWRLNWSFGKWALAGYIVGSTTPFILPWFVAAWHGNSATGLLAACVTLVGVGNMFMSGLANFLTPKAARAFNDGGVPALRQVLWRVGAAMIVVLGTLCLFFVLVGGTVLTMVYGDGYSGAAAVVALMAFAVLTQSIGIVAGNGLWAIDCPRANFGADGCTLVVTLGVAAVLVAPLGVLGAAVAMLSGQVVGTAVRCLTLVRLLRREAAAEPTFA